MHYQNRRIPIDDDDGGWEKSKEIISNRGEIYNAVVRVHSLLGGILPRNSEKIVVHLYPQCLLDPCCTQQEKNITLTE